MLSAPRKVLSPIVLPHEVKRLMDLLSLLLPVLCLFNGRWLSDEEGVLSRLDLCVIPDIVDTFPPENIHEHDINTKHNTSNKYST